MKKYSGRQIQVNHLFESSHEIEYESDTVAEDTNKRFLTYLYTA